MAETVFCSACGAANSTATQFCPQCGTASQGAAAQAPQGFGAPQPNYAQPQQGFGQPQYQQPVYGPAPKSRVTAGLFALLLGGLGVHKFYLNKVGLGILYVLFCWTFVPSVIALIEGIIYLTQDDATFSRNQGVPVSSSNGW
jgi:TM2 domain-containing membrane protein YozV